MTKPTLLVLAAGMGSRFGGDKQTSAVTPQGEFILDFSLFDARRAGFGRAVLIIRKEHRAVFEASLDVRIGEGFIIDYAYQDMDDLPASFSVPEGRTKPWGTAHAVRAARGMINEPFCVINADDFYGYEAFEMMAKHLSSSEEAAMVGYTLANTMTENGSVARGECVGEDYLESVTERLGIEYNQDQTAASYELEGKKVPLPLETIVSMNFFGFPSKCMKCFDDFFADFLTTMKDPMKSEYFLPSAVSAMINNGITKVRLFSTKDRWYGVTYKADADKVSAAMAELKLEGVYPESLWG